MDAIKIQVVRSADGLAETLTLTGPLRINGSCVITSTGFEHFFLEDGRYDGWGMPFSVAVPEGVDSMESVAETIQAVESDREIQES